MYGCAGTGPHYGACGKTNHIGGAEGQSLRHYNVTAVCGTGDDITADGKITKPASATHSHHHMPLHLFTAAKNKRDVGLLQCRPLDSTASLLQQSSARHELPPDCPPPRSATNNSTDSTRSSNSTAAET
eukprot:CAMPEP_0198291360 /NCGR_PEP_ID=MMETSP1449-20131203/8913_1 /TAXON_ID=420275 /ORGANISM="Attheya septentrionalis, Strain CCMP2084" /LENGTH=128 /DNA_ID=CAMNT_0043989987 /DNA_START=220 /DNA_END=603 /DNA_ORIENTATION=+